MEHVIDVQTGHADRSERALVAVQVEVATGRVQGVPFSAFDPGTTRRIDRSDSRRLVGAGPASW